jgi:Dihydrofolate reductase
MAAQARQYSNAHNTHQEVTQRRFRNFRLHRPLQLLRVVRSAALAAALDEHCNALIAALLQMLRKQVYLIVAVAKNGVIGSLGKLPWSLSADRERFLWLTAGQIIVYGRKTYEQELRRAIPGRLNIVVSSNPDYRPKMH